MIAMTTQFLPLTMIRRERQLPIPGRVLVHTGQRVTATDIIAETRQINEHILLDISAGLGLSTSQADNVVKLKIGEAVSPGDVIAGPVGIIPRTIRSPKSGKIVAIGGGQVLLEVDSKPFQLRAGLSGVVKALIPDRGVILETSGALVQGIWGNNQIDMGTLVVLASTPRDELTVSQIEPGLRGMILLAGHVAQGDVLRAAQELPIRGLIAASLTPNLVLQASQQTYPIIILDGFGRLPMNSIAFRILSTNDKREVSVNATTWDKRSSTRPEVIIPLPSATSQEPAISPEIFTPGQNVRILASTDAGQIGKLVSLRQDQPAFPNGVRAPAAIIRLDNGNQVIVPLANLEVVV
jgi:hypothetical protein